MSSQVQYGFTRLCLNDDMGIKDIFQAACNRCDTNMSQNNINSRYGNGH